MQKFDLKKLNYVEVKKQYPVKTSNRFAALENLVNNVDINRDRKNIRHNVAKFKYLETILTNHN
jgi:hypothetical protein